MHTDAHDGARRAAACRLALALLLSVPALPASSGVPVQADGLQAPVHVSRDPNGIVHILGETERSLVFAQGWAHARDRLFQMDVLRRLASGTLAELLGPAALADDVEVRTLGLRRAAERSLAAYSREMRTALEDYAAGVNAWLAANPLPAEYDALQLASVPPWEPLDSVAVGKLIVFQLSFELEDIGRTVDLQAYQAALGVEHGSALFFEDIYRIAPFEPQATLPAADPDSGDSVARSPAFARASHLPAASPEVAPAAASLARAYLRRLDRTDVLRRLLRTREAGGGSNAFVIAGNLTRSRRPLLANDPHLDLTAPSVLYPIRMRGVRDGFFAAGVGFAGLPYVMLGFNRNIAWGATASAVDVTDIYLDQLIPDPAEPGRLGLLYRGEVRPLTAIPQTFHANVDGRRVEMPVPADAGGVTLVTPRPDGGPILQTLPGGRALSVQWVGYAPTRELEAFRDINRARTLGQFRAALSRFDAGSENFFYADQSGTIAYLLSGEIPLREDLQAVAAGDLEAVARLVPPFLIREAAGREWVALATPPPEDQALGSGILPAKEMPRAVNPPSGILINANNDPTGDTFDNHALNRFRPGGGVRYLGADFDTGIRAGRIATLLQERLADGRLGLDDLQRIQADVVLPDVLVFVPHIVAAAANPQAVAALGNAPAVAEAVLRLARWSEGGEPRAPTGVRSGFDASDAADTARGRPTPAQIADSIAASIFSMWRAHMVANAIDAPLARLGLSKPPSRYAHRALRRIIERDGIGASGIDFFAAAPGEDASVRRDTLILHSLEQALKQLKRTFGSADPETWRWGRLHRVDMRHPLGNAFGPIGPDGPFRPPYPGLAGLPVDGGFEAVDRSTHDVRAGLTDPFSDFVFSMGPAQRFVARVGPNGVHAETALPGGVSADRDSPWFANQLGRWLVNQTVALAPGAGTEGVLLVPNRPVAAPSGGPS
jgi:penicillin G amidase